MYGIVNKAIQNLVISNYGEEVWDKVLKKSGVEVDYFISNESYDDEITYKLANAISEEMHIPIKDVLFTLGEWWVLKTAKERYGGLMESGGATLKEFLIHLPIFHNRVMMIYPNLRPPEFKVAEVSDRGIHIHYFSEREGLKSFTHGILNGLGKMYNTPVTIKELQSRDEGATHEIFEVKW